MGADLATLRRISGENAIERWLQISGKWVEEPNRRRGGESGVQRVLTDDGRLLYRKRQVGHIYHGLLHPVGYPIVIRERDALKAAAALGVKVRTPIYAGCRKVNGECHSLLATESLDGYSNREDCYANGDRERWGMTLHQRILRQCSVTLGKLNAGRWQHGCLYLKHVFVKVDGERIDIALIDPEKVRQRFSTKRATRHDWCQVKRRSSWIDTQWQAFVYGYEAAFGSANKGLQT